MSSQKRVLHLCVDSKTVKCPLFRIFAEHLIGEHDEFCLGMDLKKSDLNDKVFKVNFLRDVFEQTNFKPNMFDIVINENGPIDNHQIFNDNVKNLLKPDGKYLTSRKIIEKSGDGDEENDKMIDGFNKITEPIFQRLKETGFKYNELIVLKNKSRTFRLSVFTVCK
jgi:hypothetical protein